jgi:hypothetical protein
LYIVGRRVKVVPRYALDFHLDPSPGFGAFPFRIPRGENCSQKEMLNQPDSTMGIARPAALRKKSASFRTIGELLTQNGIAASDPCVMRFCQRELGEKPVRYSIRREVPL